MKRAVSRILWTAATVFAGLSVLLFMQHLRNDQLIRTTVRRIDAGRAMTSEQRLTTYVEFAARRLRNPTLDEIEPVSVRWYYQLNPLHPGPADVLRWGSDYRGPCGSHSAVVIAFLQVHGIRSRPLLLLDDGGKSVHTVVEMLHEGRWVVADPTYGLVFRTADGRLATHEDLAADTTTFRAQVAGVPGYVSFYDYDDVSLMNWRKIPVLLPVVRATLEATLGPERTRQIAKPLIWLRPRASFGLLSLIAALICVVLALMQSRMEQMDRSQAI